MRNIYCYEIKARKNDYRIGLMSVSAPDLFFNLNYSEEEKGKLKCYADISGFSLLDSYFDMPARVAVDIVIILLKGIIEAVDRYMLPWDYVIDTKTVYYNRKAERVKLIYRPKEKKASSKEMPIGTTSKIMLEFTNGISSKIAPEERDTFLKVMTMYFQEDKSPEECLRSLYKLRSHMKTSLDLS